MHSVVSKAQLLNNVILPRNQTVTRYTSMGLSANIQLRTTAAQYFFFFFKPANTLLCTDTAHRVSYVLQLLYILKMAGLRTNT
jgi:hypothetical protein